MPIYKRCPRCKKRLLEGTKCSCIDRRHKEEDKYKGNSKEDEFYLTKDWRIKRPIVIANLNGIDIYSLFMFNVVEPGEVVHHIVPLKDDWNKRLDDDNLIYLTEKNHRTLHAEMNRSQKDYDRVIATLQRMLKKYLSEYGGRGVYRNV